MMPFVARRMRWMVLGWAAKRVGRSRIESSVDRAAAKIEERLPDPVAKIVERLPGDAARAGGAVVVAGQGAKGATSVARSVAAGGHKLAQSGRSSMRSYRSPARSVSDRVHELRDEIAIESDAEHRRIRSDMLRETDGDGAALDALLDLRPVEADPLPSVPEPIAPGRRRFRAALPAPPVNRMRRTYRQPTKPWDRPLRRR